MPSKFNKIIITLLPVTLLLSMANPVNTAPQDQLPDIGTTAGTVLSVNQEIAMGDFYIRQMGSSTAFISDPLLMQYINKLGNQLVAHASSVRTKFHFYLINNQHINAYAFFGGNVILHSGLFRYTQNESELASVVAHEIAHVTQRHLARAMEEQQKQTPLTWIGALGSILLGMANPQAGIAALSTTLAGARQGILSFTQLNEQEADRIGMEILQRAGFDAQGMPAFMQTMADQSRYAEKPPEILLTHPLPESRLADVRNRANLMPVNHKPSSQDYLFARMRILALYGSEHTSVNQLLLNTERQNNEKQLLAEKYAQAILYYREKKYKEASHLVENLLNLEPDNIWLLDLITDIYLEQNKTEQAITRLHKAMATQSNQPVLQLNLANAWIRAGQADAASRLLYRYTFSHPNDPNGWNLLAEACAAQGLRDEELSAHAESMALNGQLSQAISLLSNASSLVKMGSLKQARYDARIDQLRQLSERYRQYQGT